MSTKSPKLPSPRLLRTLQSGVMITFFVVFALIAAGIIHVQRLSDRVARNQRANSMALCALRADLQHRAAESTAFLVTHSHGIPGISAAAVRSGITGERHTIRALGSLICSPKAVP